ncbi:MFS general substrate transporter [Xylona heveae TC161]|uniref:MFS general substrate transporter n=1 Tax=Xylona heveae (strain CBS 132557 / TC161) TaxID=1328760 RepID=A0A164ZPL8_XYLHT|nr:MFS general substrate transporter [Xylona heveae TC161]KZF19347.1 MFS general substrate transporter [Xylona heveae TC161]
MAQTLGSMIEVESAPHIRNPPAVVHRNKAPDVVELDEMSWGVQYTGPKSEPLSGTQTPRPDDLETNSVGTPQLQGGSPSGGHHEINLIQSFSKFVGPHAHRVLPPMNKWRVLCCCLINFGDGLNDSMPGAIIPYMEKHYSIGYAVVSLIFVTNALGFIMAAFYTTALQDRIGRAKTMIAGQLLMVLGYILILCTPPFPVVVLAFLFLGLGMAMNLALDNVFCANLANATMALGAMHGAYGIGGTIGPLMTTAMVSRGILWSRVYSICLGIAFFNLIFAAWSFWSFENDLPERLLSSLERTASRQAAAEAGEPSKLQILKEALKNKITLLAALFIFAYQGAEVSISGWVISFLITYRHGDPSEVGYVTSGFWAGITLGRFLLSHPCHRIGERNAVFGIVGGALAFQLLVWFLPNVIGDAVAVSIVGLLLGPVFPCATAVFSRLLSKRVQMPALSFVSAMGSSGGALAPFTTGLLAQAVGTFVLHPVAIALFVVMEGTWFTLPKARKPTE